MSESYRDRRRSRQPHRRGTRIEPRARVTGTPARAFQPTPQHDVTKPRHEPRPAPTPMRRRRRLPMLPLVGGVAVLAVVVAGAIAIDNLLARPAEPKQAPVPEPATVHFVAVGDNLPEIEIAAYADAQAGAVGDGDYDYRPVYALKDYTPELAATHPLFAGLDDPIGWMRTTSDEVVNGLGDDFTIDA